jgi:dihydropteroate synthase
MFTTIVKLDIPYVLMHIQGTPQTMQLNPHYGNVVQEVSDYFEEKLEILKNLGVKKVILDPGFGFGKTVEHNYELLKNLKEFEKFGCPILVGLSNKSFVNKVLNINSKDRSNGTAILNKIAIQNGAKILRVHDVKAAKGL